MSANSTAKAPCVRCGVPTFFRLCRECVLTVHKENLKRTAAALANP